MSFWASIKPKEEKKQGPYIAPTLPTTDNSTVAFRDATAKSDIVGTAKTTGTIAKVLGQSIMREGAALSSFAFPNVGPLTPTGPVQEAIYGTDKPITLTSFGREVRMADPEGESKGFWKTFDPALGLLVGALDVMPGGKPTKSLITGFAKETSQAKIADDLVKIAPKLAPDTVWGLAGKLAAETSEDEVRMLLQNADIIPKASNANRGVTGTAKLENIADDDLGEIIDFVDSVRLGEEPTANNSIAARRLAERYGINPEQSDADRKSVV